MPPVGHHDNRFDIRLSNINDLNHAVKEHERRLVWEETHPDTLPEGWFHSAHEEPADRFEIFSNTISELKSEFGAFFREQAWPRASLGNPDRVTPSPD
jgi:hypothetical protein